MLGPYCSQLTYLGIIPREVQKRDPLGTESSGGSQNSSIPYCNNVHTIKNGDVARGCEERSRRVARR